MDNRKYYNYVLYLAFFTIVYNFLEGIVATYFGASDDNIALFGFGVNSFNELIWGFGIAHMIYRIKNNQNIDSQK